MMDFNTLSDLELIKRMYSATDQSIDEMFDWGKAVGVEVH